MRDRTTFEAFLAVLLWVSLIGGAACGVLEPELPFELPAEDTSTDPNALRLGEYVYPCGNWLGGRRPSEDHLLVDVFFHLDFYDDPFEVDRPTLDQRRLVEYYGGVILRSYHIAGMRVWLPTDAVPILHDSGASVRSVPDPSRFDTEMHIDFRTRDDFRADSARVIELGGRLYIPHRLGFAALPNRAVPRLRERPSIARIFYGGSDACGFARGGP